MKVILVLFSILFISCQAKQKKVDTPFNEDIRIVLKANKPELYACYKEYIIGSEDPSKGVLTLGWKVFGNRARDVLIIRSIHPDLDFCIKTVVQGIRFDDLYLGKQVGVVRYNFYFQGGQLDLDFRAQN